MKIDAVGTFSEDLVVLSSDLAALLGCRGIGTLASRRTSCNKLAMRMTLAEDPAIAQPRFKAYNIFDDSVDILREFPKPCVIKPVFGIASHGVVMIESNDFDIERLRADIAGMVNERNRAPFKRFIGNMLIEEYIPGTMMSIDGFVRGGTPVIVGRLEFIMRKEPYFTQSASYIPARISPDDDRSVRQYVWSVIEKLGFEDTSFHAEVRMSERGPVLVEIAGRMAGGTIHRSYDRVYGIDMIDMMFKCWLGEEFATDPVVKGYNYHSFVYPDIAKASIIKSIEYPPIGGMPEIYVFNKKGSPGYALQVPPEMPNSVLEYACFSKDMKRLEEIRDTIVNNITITYV